MDGGEGRCGGGGGGGGVDSRIPSLLSQCRKIIHVHMVVCIPCRIWSLTDLSHRLGCDEAARRFVEDLPSYPPRIR